MLWSLLTWLLLWITSFPPLHYAFMNYPMLVFHFPIQMFFTWKIFPRLGTLEESVLEDHFHLLHTLIAYPSYPLTCCSIMSSTLLDIGATQCDLAWEFDAHSIWRQSLYIFIDPEKIQKNDIFQKFKKIDIFQKSKKMIYCENFKNWKMFWKKWSSQWQPSNRHFDVSQKKIINSKNTKKKNDIFQKSKKLIYFKNPKKWYIIKSLKIEKCPQKNDHLSENLAIGALMYIQKNYIFHKYKKNKKWKNEKIAIRSKWWEPKNRHYLRSLHPLFLSVCPQHLAFLHHSLSLFPWFGIGPCLCLWAITMWALVSWMH